MRAHLLPNSKPPGWLSKDGVSIPWPWRPEITELKNKGSRKSPPFRKERLGGPCQAEDCINEA